MSNREQEQVEDLFGTEAIEKMKALVKAEAICHFVSNLSRIPLNTRPMAVLEVDDNGNFWFFSAKDSDKNHDIHANNNVQLFFCNHGDAEYLTVFGKAWVVEDKQRIKDLWIPMAKSWFQEGVDDPQLTLIKVVPEEAYYWDTRNNKIVSMLKILTSIVSGKRPTDGVKGELKV
jgi:general stress protein 26